MPKRQIKRLYYRNGQVRTEDREVGGELHGLCRTWHYNGQLAEELSYRHGQLHGVSRQWDTKGRLLGSFAMNHGTGRQLYWHDNGRLRLEINSLNGKYFGRLRMWLWDGTLVQENYYISNVDVTLTVGEVSQQVNVDASVAQLQTDSSANCTARLPAF